MKTSREQFEEWFPQMVEGMPENMVKVFDEMLFMAWQASRAPIEIELPERHYFCDNDGSFFAAEEIIYEIEQAGIKVKS